MFPKIIIENKIPYKNEDSLCTYSQNVGVFT